MPQTWLNSDGLYLKYGPDKATAGTAGEYVMTGNIHEIMVEITLTSLGTAAAVMSDTVFVPAGARISQVEILNKTAATSGGSAVLNVGLIRMDRSTELDYDGFVAAAALATFNAAGERVTLDIGSTGVGALVGTTLANNGYITADYDTAAFTAGVVQVRIRYYMP